MKQALQKIKKISINIFIILCLWITLSVNFRVKIPEYTGDNPVIKEINWQVNRIDWGLRYIGWSAMLSTYWRMFSPVDRFNWLPHYYALYADGSMKRLPETYHVKERSFLERNLIDFREAKFQLNIYYNQIYEDFNMAYMCRKYSTPQNQLRQVFLKIQTQYIESPGNSFKTGNYWNPEKFTQTTNTLNCDDQLNVQSME